VDRRRASGEPGIVSCSALKRAYRQCIIGERDSVRLVYLKGRQELIAARLAARKGHFMPASLLDSQFATLEEPQPGEEAAVVSVAMPPGKVANEIIARLGLRLRRREG
jgi:gluconokinase